MYADPNTIPTMNKHYNNSFQQSKNNYWEFILTQLLSWEINSSAGEKAAPGRNGKLLATFTVEQIVT